MRYDKKVIASTFMSLVFAIIQFSIIIFFHFYRKDHDPVMQTMSEYTIGQLGFLFPIGLLILGLSSIFSFYSLRLTLPKSRLTKKILRYFLFWTIFIIITGIFPTDYITGPYTFSGITHALASYFAFLFLMLSLYYIAVFLKKEIKSPTTSLRFYTYFSLCIPGLVIFLIMPLAYKGLTQRIFLTIIFTAYIEISLIPIRKKMFQV